MKFAHLADVHLGAWKYPALQKLNIEAFNYAIEKCLTEKVSFVVIAGDLFDVAMPGIDILEETVSILKKLKDAGIKCFVAPGSHDFSITGKTFLGVFEKADLLKNVFFISDNNDLIHFYDSSLNICLSGLGGRKAGVEVSLFKNLKFKQPDQSKINIFIFHTTLTESKPEEMQFVESISIADLPNGFDYYAGGHLHLVAKHKKERAFVTYPGALFPTNIEELEKFGQGNFLIIEINEETKETLIKDEPVRLKDVLMIECNVDGLDPNTATSKILSKINEYNVEDKIVLLKVYGILSSGKVSEINFKEIEESLVNSYCFLKNLSDLSTKEFNLALEVKGETIDVIENNLITQYFSSDVSSKHFFKLVLPLFNSLNNEKYDGEKKEDYEQRIYFDFKKLLEELS